jgi:Xaa-Pro aminopeptidase
VNGDLAGRVDRARRVLEQHGLDALLLSVGSDLPYLTGYRAMPLERLTMAVVTADGPVSLVVPELEAPRVARRDDLLTVMPWGETSDPIALVAAAAGDAAACALGDETWSVFLLALQEAMPGCRFVPAAPLMATLRMRKDAAEIDALRRAAEAADRVVARLRDHRFAGTTERALAGEIAAMTVAEGHDAATFTIVASGPNSASPHHEPGDRVIASGDAVVVDFGGTVDGYNSDTTRTFHVGRAGEEYLAVHATVRRAQEAALAAVRPGVAAGEVDRTARRIIEDAGHGEHFIHRTGHGIGLDVHEHPYLVADGPVPLEPGMTFSIEPGIYLPGRFGVRIEDIVVVGSDGAVALNTSTHEPIEVA